MEEQAYKEILDLIKKYESVITFDYDSMKAKAGRHLFGVMLRDKYGFNIDPKRIDSKDWYRVNEYMDIGFYYGDRKISWSDDNRQPDNEYLLRLSFCAGAYIFGAYIDGQKDYPTEFFKSFWNELLPYCPKYTDTHNHSLYFALDNAGKVFNDFPALIKKYYDLNKKDAVQRKRSKLLAELEKLKEA